MIFYAFTDSCAWTLFVIRLLVGITFALHGSQKVFGLFDGPGLTGFAHYVTTLGLPAILGYCAALIEFFAGMALTLGIMPRIAALLLIPLMFVAIWKVHLRHGFFGYNGGFEYPLNLIILLFVLIIAGPGKFSLLAL